MVNELRINGTQDFMGFNIPIVEGGFGKNCRVITAKTVAEIHEVRMNDIQDLIIQNINEFEIGVDLLDLCDDNFKTDAIGLGLITSNRQKHCYLLSEQGYMLLVGFMKTEKSKEIRKNIRREYFAMRQIINSSEQLKAQLLLSIYNGGQNAVVASKQLTEIEVQEATAPLIEENKRMKPKEDFYDAVAVAENCMNFGDFATVFQNNNNISFGRNKILKWRRERNYLCSSPTLKNKPNQQVVDRGYMKYKESIGGLDDKQYITYTPLLTGKGQIWLTKKLLKYFKEQL